MKLLQTLTAVSLSLTAYTSAALAAETAETATDSVDPSVSGVLPAEKTDAGNATADKAVSAAPDAKHEGREAKNALYVDLLGPGLIYSLNYDREIVPDLSARIGISYMSLGASSSDGSASVSFSYLAIPITASYLGIGSQNNCLELGGGPVIMNFKGSGLIESNDESVSAGASVTTLALTGMAGYRHQPADGGFLFRIGVSPMMVFGANFVPWGYLSLGAAF
ncbi:MAG TPA: hypothetical protein VFS67_37195 [Polyangiaceae bacterium]|jgi:hypothetical protein|nr:hypothetical protein [Polyangiaceae bacterium]